MKPIVFTAVAWPLLTSCQESKTRPVEDSPRVETHSTSQRLAEHFPLLPTIEAQRWSKLRHAEKLATDSQAPPENRHAAALQVTEIATQLQKNHPFLNDQDRTILGGIVYLKKSKQIVIPAQVKYPNARDTRHPGELELILCSNTGRTHETLFTTTVRPLHLELLLHLAGFKNSNPASKFTLSISIPSTPPIPIENLIQSIDHKPLPPSQLQWEFSGSNFGELYPPDQTGDLIITWHAHDSVLRINDGKIANGELKLTPKTHPSLDQDMPVKLILSPTKS